MDYYHRHPREYFEGTVGLDPAFFLDPFAARLPAGARLLDVGCGAGRDLLWFRRRGFAAVGFERSPGLAELAGAHSGCRIIRGDFETYDFSSLSFDALSLCGSLVHLPHPRLGPVLKRIAAALVPAGGLIYLSLKEGLGSKVDSRGRSFFFWQDSNLRPILGECGFRVLETACGPSADGSATVWRGYVLISRRGKATSGPLGPDLSMETKPQIG